MFRSVCCIFATVVLIAGCARTPPSETDWPENIPAMSFYNAVYDDDADNQAVQSRGEYLTWVLRFYEGWTLYEEGWIWTTNQVLRGIENETERDRVREKMAAVGQRISAEWSKDAANRYIFTRTIAAWGQALLESVNRDEEEELLDRVAADLDDLFAGRLASEDILYERYYEEDAIEFF